MPPREKQIRYCPCGCGEVVPLMFDKTGRFKGYARGVPGHRRQLSNEAMRDKRRQYLAEYRRTVHTKPVGATRLHNAGRDLTYRVVKVPETGRWRYEHRV